MNEHTRHSSSPPASPPLPVSGKAFSSLALNGRGGPASEGGAGNLRTLSHAEWGILQGLLIGVGVGALAYPPALVSLIAIVPAYLLTRKAQARDEELQPTVQGFNFLNLGTSAEPVTSAPASLPKEAPAPKQLPPSFEDVRAQVRLETLEEAERELLDMKAKGEQLGLNELAVDIERSLQDVQALKEELHLRERHDLRERVATLQGFIDALKAER